MSDRNAKKSNIRKIFYYIKNYRIYLIFSIILAAVTVVLTLYLPILFGSAIDAIIGVDNVDFPVLSSISKKCIAVIAATALSQWLMNVLNNKLSFDIVRDVRKEAFKKLWTAAITKAAMIIENEAVRITEQHYKD